MDASPFASGSSSLAQNTPRLHSGASPFSKHISITPPEQQSPFPFTSELVASIHRRRVVLRNELFIDMLFSLSGILSLDETSLYPPATPEAYEDLLQRIEEASWTALKKSCLVYYLLRFWNGSVAEEFVSRKLLPAQFVMLADAYWLLDNGDEHVPNAIALLCDPRVKPDFISKILYTISISSHFPHQNLLRFVRTAKPVLTDPNDLELYLRSICHADGLVEAWHYQRTFPEMSPLRRKFIAVIFEFALSPKPQPLALRALLTLPLTPYEESLLHGYALHPPNALPEASLALLQDLVVLRLTNVGKYAEAIKLDRQFSSEAAKAGRVGGSSPVVRASETRKKMLDELKASLPQAQQRLLDILSEDKQQQPSTVGSFSTLGAFSSGSGELVNGGDMEMSWEGINSAASASSSFMIPSTKPPSPTRPSFVNVAQLQQPLSASPALRRSDPQGAVFKAFASASGSGQPPPPSSSTPAPFANSNADSRVAKILNLTGGSSTPRRHQSPFGSVTPQPALGRKSSFGNLAPSTLFSSTSSNPFVEQSLPQSQSRPLFPPSSTSFLGTSTPFGKKVPSSSFFAPTEELSKPSFAPWAAPRPSFGNGNATKRRRQSDVAPPEVNALQNEQAGMDMDSHDQVVEDIQEDDDIILDPPSAFAQARNLVNNKRMNGTVAQPTPQPSRDQPPAVAAPVLVTSRRRSSVEPEVNVAVPGAFPTSPKATHQPPPLDNNLRKSAPSTTRSRAKKADDPAPAPPSPRKSTRRSARASSINTDEEETSDGQPLRRSARLSSLPAPDASPDRKKLRSSSQEPEPLSPTKSSRGGARRGRGKGTKASVTSSRGRPQTVVEE